MHTKMGEVKTDIDKVIADCGVTWAGQRHVAWLKLQRRHIRKIRDRIYGGPWTGSKEGEDATTKMCAACFEAQRYEQHEWVRPEERTNKEEVMCQDDAP